MTYYLNLALSLILALTLSLFLTLSLTLTYCREGNVTFFDRTSGKPYTAKPAIVETYTSREASLTITEGKHHQVACLSACLSLCLSVHLQDKTGRHIYITDR